MGYLYSIKDGFLKVSKGTFEVVIGNKFGNLYKMIGSTIVGGATLIFEDLNFEDTMLWHMKLGHLGEKNMLEFHNNILLKGEKTCMLIFVYIVFTVRRKEFVLRYQITLVLVFGLFHFQCLGICDYCVS